MADTLVRTPKPRADKETSAGARLPYARHVDDATIGTRDGRLLQVIKLDGFLFETADTDELNYRKAVRETMLRGVANSRFAIYHHVVRREVEPRLEGDYPDAFSRSLHEAWRGAARHPAALRQRPVPHHRAPAAAGAAGRAGRPAELRARRGF